MSKEQISTVCYSLWDCVYSKYISFTGRAGHPTPQSGANEENGASGQQYGRGSTGRNQGIQGDAHLPLLQGMYHVLTYIL